MGIDGTRIEIKQWTDALGLFHSKRAAGLVFRGQSDSKWDLSTTLERASKKRGAAGTETLLIQAFKSRAHQFGLPVPTKGDHLEWLALMQHYGVPTRLLDWTRSPYVAAYFAAERAAKDAEFFRVWAVDVVRLRGAAIQRLKVSELTKLGDPNPFMKWFMGNTFLFVAPIQASRSNERLASQQGLFLCPGSLNSGFQRNLQEMDGVGEHLLEIDFPVAMRCEVLSNLESMNINRATLFPGLEGFVQYLEMRVYLRDHSESDVDMVDARWREFGFL